MQIFFKGLPGILLLIKRTYSVALDKGNRLQVEIGDPRELDRLRNIDSILMVFYYLYSSCLSP